VQAGLNVFVVDVRCHAVQGSSVVVLGLPVVVVDVVVVLQSGGLVSYSGGTQYVTVHSPLISPQNVG
jgi:hypothetical protein